MAERGGGVVTAVATRRASAERRRLVPSGLCGFASRREGLEFAQ